MRVITSKLLEKHSASQVVACRGGQLEITANLVSHLCETKLKVRIMTAIHCVTG